ncbi:MAG: glutamate--tRNA ligase [archaeon]
MDKKMKELAFKYAVRNAFEHNGKADLKAVIAKLIAIDKELAKNLGKNIREITETIEKVNSMQAKELQETFNSFTSFDELPERKQKEEMQLDWAKKEKVVTRYAPNPNGPIHLGNARALLNSFEYAKKYNGKFILRFDDTDPKVKKPIKNAEMVFKTDLNWLGVKVDETFFASDRMEIYYNYMKKIILMGKAYVCFCEKEKWKELIDQNKPCPCREKDSKEQLKEFEKMLSNELKEGTAVLRIKTDLEAKDPSLRDWWAAKIVDNPEHPRTGSKYHVWPSYNFASAIDDHELGISLIIRGQEHAQNTEKQKFLYGYLGWSYPHVFNTGRIKLKEMVLSTSKIKEGIEKGEFTGWDDPRLGTIQALRKRGFSSQTIKEIIREIGVKSSDVTVDFMRMIDLNKSFIDKKSDRYYFIQEPVRLTVNFMPEIEIEKPVHPDFPDQTRTYVLNEGSQEFLISKKDAGKLEEGSIVRLKHAINFRVLTKDETQVFGEFTGTQKLENKPLIQWILNETTAEILMDDNTKKLGSIEEEILEEKEGNSVQLENFGYARIDSIEKNKVFLRFTHK